MKKLMLIVAAVSLMTAGVAMALITWRENRCQDLVA